ncbi:kinase-like protein [Laetiporus sulphureus 93-53]|uniref:non-specific serine/threonine protein kinase n=1 Tax=Laetiporus sulphureus 93-53 TaxID=1314785 RepID=A0A165E9L8_9APHY|nr:kinase-like protein [Laetiporus sulphureus 93-53]KZT06535.1 kinase-like protein [Laetiporus sulphureus 93-53]
MATATLLSRHSSNPFEVPSSDRNHRKYRHDSARVQGIIGDDESHPSSDHSHDSYAPPIIDEFHAHLAKRYADIQDTAMNDDTKAVASAHERDDEPSSDQEEYASPHGTVNDEQDEDEEEMRENLGEDDEDAGEIPAYTDEERTIFLKPRSERHEIEQEIADLEAAVPQLIPDYKIVDRLGTGTFSSVYKAVDLGYHTKWDNTPWHGFHSPSSSAYYQSALRPSDSKAFVAIKRIYVTSGPERIRNEISILEDCRGCRHISQLITAFRHHDQVVAIMPYNRHQDFRDYYRILPMEGIKAYFRCMFRALRDIHARGIIHRDVKPANFLFDPRTGIGTLCDFGLACRMERGPTLGACLHTAPSREYPHGRIRPREEYDPEYIKRKQREGRLKSILPSDKVGYPLKDNRPVSKANRAGTRGFRAPEVLFKCGEQTGAIDVWSAGMILLFFLARKFPLFHSNDDVEALMEISTIVGKKKMEKAATLHSRVLQTNVPNLTQDGITWCDFVERQNPLLHEPPAPDPRFFPYAGKSGVTSGHFPTSSPRSSPERFLSPELPIPTPDAETYTAEVEKALDLLEQVMHPESTRRITPRRALAHSFLRDPDAPDDDEFFPYPFGEGVCGELHFIDEDTDEYCVKVRIPGEEKMTVRRIAAGEGIAIGKRACEFHRKENGYEY